MAKVRKSEKIVIGKTEVVSKDIKLKEVLVKFIDDLEVAESISYKDLQVFPVFKSEIKPVPGLKLLSEALKEGLVEIKETGTVSEIVIKNNSDFKILALRGDIVKGGAQNRVLTASLIIDEKSEVKVPSGCVQAGRWNTFSAPFEETKIASPGITYMVNASSNAAVLKSSGSSYAVNQSELWGDIHSVMSGMGVFDSTSDYTAIYTSKKDEIEEYRKSFVGNVPITDKDMIGIVVTVGGILKADICVDHEMFLAGYDNLMEGCFIDAVANEGKFTNKIIAEMVNNFLNSLTQIEWEDFPTPSGCGKNLIPKSELITGNVLVFKDEIIHFSVLKKQ